MNTTLHWSDTNRARLLESLGEVRALLELHARNASPVERAAALDATTAQDNAPPAAIDSVCDAFGLSPFERRLLLLCAGMELESTFAAACAACQVEPRRAYPTFSLALAALPDAHWSALLPAAPLRMWRLIEVLPGDALTTSQLRIDERVLHHLTGLSYLDERLQPLLRPIDPAGALADSQSAAADRVTEAWRHEEAGQPFVQLCGDDAAACRAVAAVAGARSGAAVYEVRASDLPTVSQDSELLRRLWQREAVFTDHVLLLDCHDCEPVAQRMAALLVDGLVSKTIVHGREPLPFTQRSRVRIDVPRPDTREQIALWEQVLGEAAVALNGQTATVAEQFRLGLDAVRAAGAHVRAHWQAHGNGKDEGSTEDLLWHACRVHARPTLDDLAQRIEPAAGWDDLVLPAPQKELLRQIAANAAQRATVYERWGFGARSSSGLGLTCLFAGASGTGKTMAAEVLARSLRLDLYRIDLSQVISKYIGETEKNLARVFDAAEAGGAVLLFDEADALFGKRSEVKDSHDRYANIEVSYLLQRMESYRGLAVLTSNLKNALDPSFLRRLRFVVQFPFPDSVQRADIWSRVFPAATPTQGLDPAKLGRLTVAGGNIRNIAVNAAFLAAAAGQPVGMDHVLRAAQAEYAKLERPLTDAEVSGWR